MKTDTRQLSTRERSVEVLNRMFGLLDCSLARYMSHARPWVRQRYMLLDAVVRRISYEHEKYARRLAQLIHDRRGTVNSSVFPMGFTAYNDLSLEYLAPRLLEHQRALIVTAEDSVRDLGHDPEARQVVSNIVSSLQRFGELLQELLVPHRTARPAACKDGAKASRRSPSSVVSKRFERRMAEGQTAA